jgi:probable HAF family extracellular repeat protein
MSTRLRRRTRTVTTLAGLAALAAAGLSSAALGADAYTATAIPNSIGGFFSEAYGVNDAGTVVGRMDDADGNVFGFVSMNGGPAVALPVLTDGYDAWPTGVNAGNVIVGSCRNAAGVSRAVTWRFDTTAGAWTITELPTLRTDNAGLGVAVRINTAGQIVGYASSDAGGYHACLWTAGVPADLGTLSYTGNLAYSQGLGINDAGDTCGFAYRVLGGPEHGWVYRAGTRGQEDVTTANGARPLAQWHSINAAGTLAGYISDTTTAGHFVPAINEAGVGFTKLPLIAGLEDGYGYDVNDSGVVVGANFLLNPVPNPNVFAAFKYEAGATVDLNTVTSGLPGIMSEARDVSNTGLIVGLTDAGVAVLLTPAPVTPPCRADYNGMNGVDLLDIFAFLHDWFAGDVRADFDGRNGVDLTDIFAFLNAWFAGCP